MFIETKDGDFINVAHIERFFHRDKPRKETVLKTATGDTYITWDCLDHNTFYPVVPAHPDFFALVFWTDGKDECVDKHPVLAWRITDNGAWPITADPELEYNDIAILYPDGRVIEPHEGNYANYTAWLHDRRDAYRRRQERLAANTQA